MDRRCPGRTRRCTVLVTDFRGSVPRDGRLDCRRGLSRRRQDRNSVGGWRRRSRCGGRWSGCCRRRRGRGAGGGRLAKLGGGRLLRNGLSGHGVGVGFACDHDQGAQEENSSHADADPWQRLCPDGGARGGLGSVHLIPFVLDPSGRSVGTVTRVHRLQPDDRDRDRMAGCNAIGTTSNDRVRAVVSVRAGSGK